MAKTYKTGVLIRMTPEMHDAIKTLAEQNDRTMAQEVRRAVRFHLAAGDQR